MLSSEEYEPWQATRAPIRAICRPRHRKKSACLLRRAGLDLPEELLTQFVAAWPSYEAMVRRIPRSRPYDEEPAHSFRPSRFF